MRDFPPTHPGEILIEEFLKPMGISADTALRLARYFGMSVGFWTGIHNSIFPSNIAVLQHFCYAPRGTSNIFLFEKPCW